MTTKDPKIVDAGSEVTTEKRIDILLKEYDTLRTEILQAIKMRFSFIGFFGVVSAYFIFNAEPFPYYKYLLLISGFLFLLALWMSFGRIITGCSKRIAEIEKMINNMAGKELLVWETKNQKNILHRFNKFNQLGLNYPDNNDKENKE
jgi:hypothetical protein